MLNQEPILYFIPLYICYIIVIGLFMFRTRFAAVKKGELSGGFFKAYQGAQPHYLQIVQNHFSNQFEVPVLFMVTCLAIAVAKGSSSLTVGLAALFFATRVIHTLIHLGKNKVLHRAGIYFFGIFVILAMWACLL